MPSDTIIGRDVLLYFLVNGIYQQAACATECSFNVHTDTVEVTTKTSNAGQGSWRKLKPVFNSWSGSVTGIQLLDTPLKFSDIRKMQTDLTTVYIQYNKVGKSGTRYESWFGAGVITDTNETAGVDDFAQFDIQIEGYGALTSDFTPTNLNSPLEMWYYYTCTGNEGSSWIIDDMQGMVISGRIYREGLEISASGTQTTNRPAADTPIAGQFQWDAVNGRITLSQFDPPTSPGERIDIPYTGNYVGCSLAINNFKAALNSANKFVLSWQGTGIPKNQLLFEYSSDFGATFNPLNADLDLVNLDNAIVTDALDTTASDIFRLTPVCTNNAKGRPAVAYWNTTLISIVNNRTDGVKILFVTYKDAPTTEYPVSCTSGVNQLTNVNATRMPYANANYLKVICGVSTATTITVTVKTKEGTVLGKTTNTISSSIDVTQISLSTYLPNEFTVVLD